MAADPNGLFEDDRDADGNLVLSEFGERLKEITEDAMKRQVDYRMDQLVETVDAYFELVNESSEDSVSELRKLMILAVSELGGAPARDAFLAKIAALARSGALSSATGAWAQGSPHDSGSDRGSVHGGGVSVRKESRHDDIED